jgi:toxin-antitoxin system PIN domain toxin
MIAIDTNILVYAHRLDMTLHDKAAAAVKRCAEGDSPWAVPWPCAHEFLAIVTNPRVFRKPSRPAEALQQLKAWCGSPTVRLLGELDDHLDALARLLHVSKVVGGKIHDARIAALCVEHGVAELWTADRDFSRFPGIKVRNPLSNA